MATTKNTFKQQQLHCQQNYQSQEPLHFICWCLELVQKVCFSDGTLGSKSLVGWFGDRSRFVWLVEILRFWVLCRYKEMPPNFVSWFITGIYWNNKLVCGAPSWTTTAGWQQSYIYYIYIYMYICDWLYIALWCAITVHYVYGWVAVCNSLIADSDSRRIPRHQTSRTPLPGVHRAMEGQ